MVRTSPGEQNRSAHTSAHATWWFAAGVVVLELVARAAGFDSLGLAAAALVAPGFALSGLLPPRIRRLGIARATVAPAFGIACTSIVLISIAKVGIRLDELSVHAVLVVLVALGWLVPRDEPVGGDGSSEPISGVDAQANRGMGVQLGAERGLRVPRIVIDSAALAVALTIAVVLGWRVISPLPLPGDDWAKYLLYADEIRKHGAILLQNQLWMGGRPFSEDPGVPSLEGSALIMTGAPAGLLVHTILFLTLAQVAAAFGAARARFGLVGGFITAALLAIVPATQNILGWHGLANVGALAIAAVILAQLGAWAAGELDRRAELGLAITLVGVAAAHRLTAAFTLGTIGFVVFLVLLFGPRRVLLLSGLRTVGMAIIVGFIVVLDLQKSASESGGTLPYTSYLGTKVQLNLALRDISPVLAGAVLLTVVILGVRRRLPRETWPGIGLALVSCVLAYAYVLHLPLYYSRSVFFLPMALAPIAGAGAAALWAWLSDGRSARRRNRAAAIGLVLVVAIGSAMGVRSWHQAAVVRTFYAFASPTALKGIDAVDQDLKPNEIVATDRCWSFLATWLLHTRTYPALEDQDIQPKAELVVAHKAAAILHGTTEGRQLIRELGVRYAFLDPTCPVSGKRFAPPGTVVFASERLAIIKLDPNGVQRVVKKLKPLPPLPLTPFFTPIPKLAK